MLVYPKTTEKVLSPVALPVASRIESPSSTHSTNTLKSNPEPSRTTTCEGVEIGTNEEELEELEELEESEEELELELVIKLELVLEFLF